MYRHMTYLSTAVFFFQAEDGIRDRTVTGVQTCALPIYFLALMYQLVQKIPGAEYVEAVAGVHTYYSTWLVGSAPGRRAVAQGPASELLRSEERRVGKACSCLLKRRHSKITVASSALAAK